MSRETILDEDENQTTYSCEWCGTTFIKKSNLDMHLKTAKYCLAERNGEIQSFKCEGCEKQYSTLSVLTRHKKGCKDFSNYSLRTELNTLQFKTEMIISSYEFQISKLQDQLKTLETQDVETKATIYEKEYLAIRDKPTTTVNNGNITTIKLKSVNIATIDPFTIETVIARLGRGEYSYERFCEGMRGLEAFLLGIMIKDDEKSYVTTDKSRSNFHRLEENRQWIGDAGALFLMNVFDAMIPIMNEHWDRYTLPPKQKRSIEEIEYYSNELSDLNKIALGILRSDIPARKQLIGEVIKTIKLPVAI